MIIEDISETHECIFLLFLSRHIVPLLRASEYRGVHVIKDAFYSLVAFMASPHEHCKLLFVEVALVALILEVRGHDFVLYASHAWLHKFLCYLF